MNIYFQVLVNDYFNNIVYTENPIDKKIKILQKLQTDFSEIYSPGYAEKHELFYALLNDELLACQSKNDRGVQGTTSSFQIVSNIDSTKSQSQKDTFQYMSDIDSTRNTSITNVDTNSETYSRSTDATKKNPFLSTHSADYNTQRRTTTTGRYAFGETVYVDSKLAQYTHQLVNIMQVINIQNKLHSFTFTPEEYLMNNAIIYDIRYNMYTGLDRYNFIAHNFLHKKHLELKKDILMKTQQYKHMSEDQLQRVPTFFELFAHSFPLHDVEDRNNFDYQIKYIPMYGRIKDYLNNVPYGFTAFAMPLYFSYTQAFPHSRKIYSVNLHMHETPDTKKKILGHNITILL